MHFVRRSRDIVFVAVGCNLPAVGFRSTHELMLNVLKDVELDFDMCLLFSEVCMKFF